MGEPCTHAVHKTGSLSAEKVKNNRVTKKSPSVKQQGIDHAQEGRLGGFLVARRGKRVAQEKGQAKKKKTKSKGVIAREST